MDAITEMDEENSMSDRRAVKSPEIVEIEEERDMVESISDVFVAVGKNDMDVVKWAVDHLVSPGARLYLVHVFPPITHIPTPVGKFSISQLSKEQVQVYVNEENNKRRSLLQKYIHLCTNAKVIPETMLFESNTPAKAILDLIPIVNITKLVIGTKRPPSLRRLRKGPCDGEFIKKNAPDFCDVKIIYDGKLVRNDLQQHIREITPTTATTIDVGDQNGSQVVSTQSERNIFECVCFRGKLD